jgi:predicted component of type VI protein secretion system
LYEATLWRQFERTFEGAVHGKDETLRTLLAMEFRQAYERHLAEAAERRPRA